MLKSLLKEKKMKNSFEILYNEPYDEAWMVEDVLENLQEKRYFDVYPISVTTFSALQMVEQNKILLQLSLPITVLRSMRKAKWKPTLETIIEEQGGERQEQSCKEKIDEGEDTFSSISGELNVNDVFDERKVFLSDVAPPTNQYEQTSATFSVVDKEGSRIISNEESVLEELRKILQTEGKIEEEKSLEWLKTFIGRQAKECLTNRTDEVISCTAENVTTVYSVEDEIRAWLKSITAHSYQHPVQPRCFVKLPVTTIPDEYWPVRRNVVATKLSRKPTLSTIAELNEDEHIMQQNPTVKNEVDEVKEISPINFMMKEELKEDDDMIQIVQVQKYDASEDTEEEETKYETEFAKGKQGDDEEIQKWYKTIKESNRHPFKLGYYTKLPIITFPDECWPKKHKPQLKTKKVSRTPTLFTIREQKETEEVIEENTTITKEESTTKGKRMVNFLNKEYSEINYRPVTKIRLSNTYTTEVMEPVETDCERVIARIVLDENITEDQVACESHIQEFDYRDKAGGIPSILLMQDIDTLKHEDDEPTQVDVGFKNMCRKLRKLFKVKPSEEYGQIKKQKKEKGKYTELIKMTLDERNTNLKDIDDRQVASTSYIPKVNYDGQSNGLPSMSAMKNKDRTKQEYENYKEIDSVGKSKYKKLGNLFKMKQSKRNNPTEKYRKKRNTMSSTTNKERHINLEDFIRKTEEGLNVIKMEIESDLIMFETRIERELLTDEEVAKYKESIKTNIEKKRNEIIDAIVFLQEHRTILDKKLKQKWRLTGKRGLRSLAQSIDSTMDKLHDVTITIAETIRNLQRCYLPAECYF